MTQECRPGGETWDVTTLELREELPVIERQQVQSGQVSFRREVRVRTETVTLELRFETLRIEVGPGEAAVYLGDVLLQPGEVREVLLYDERLMVSKHPYVTEEVKISKRAVTEVQETRLNLSYEVLVTDQTGSQTPTPAP
ncbi:YsnF/AvaK domain-containing protein [Deinococcus sp.]|uniref:YsnF/AvaK domain-containing protein n=1 Tax=Deinococcus sp. TaxID=47478 RepID=UPI003C7AAB2D